MIGAAMKHLTKALVSASFLLGAATTAQAATVDFSGLGPNGTEVTAGALDFVTSLTVDSNGSVDSLITFDTTLTGTADLDLQGPFDDPFTPGNDNNNALGFIAIIAENTDFANPDDEAAGGLVTFNFDRPLIMKSTTFVDTIGGEVRLYGNDGLIMTFDIPNVDTSDNVLPNRFTTLSYGAVAGVTRLEIFLDESGGFDNIEFSQVPVPAALPLFLAGFGGLAAAKRRKKA